MEFHTKGLDDFHHRGELRITVDRKRTIQTLAGNSSVTRSLTHPMCTRNNSQGMSHQCGITTLQACIQIQQHVFFSFKKLSGIVEGKFFCHDAITPFLRNDYGAGNVGILRTFRATAHRSFNPDSQCLKVALWMMSIMVEL